MPQLKDVVLTDDTESHTFTPVNIDRNGVAFLSERTGVPVADPQLSVSLRKTSNNYRSTVALTLPVAQAAGADGKATEVVRVLRARLDFTLPASSTEAERTTLVNEVESALGNPDVIRGILVELSGPY